MFRQSNDAPKIQKEVGWNLRIRRIEMGKTLKEVAESTGLSVSLLSQAERAETPLSLRSLAKLAEFYGVQPYQLLVPPVTPFIPGL